MLLAAAAAVAASLRRLPLLLDDAASGSAETAPVPAVEPASPSAPVPAPAPVSSNFRRLHSGASELLALVLVQEPDSERDMPLH